MITAKQEETRRIALEYGPLPGNRVFAAWYEAGTKELRVKARNEQNETVELRPKGGRLGKRWDIALAAFTDFDAEHGCWRLS